MADVVDDQPAVGADLLEEIGDFPFQGHGTGVVEDPQLLGRNAVALGQGVRQQRGIGQRIAQRAEPLVVVVLHGDDQGPARGVGRPFRGNRRGGNGRLALGVDRFVLDRHAVAGPQHVERDRLVAQRDLALRADEIGHLLPAILRHAERLRRLVADLLHDPAAGRAFAGRRPRRS